MMSEVPRTLSCEPGSASDADSAQSTYGGVGGAAVSRRALCSNLVMIKNAALSVLHKNHAHVQVERVAPRVAAMRAACKKQERGVAALTAQLRAAGIQPLVSPCASRFLPYLSNPAAVCILECWLCCREGSVQGPMACTFSACCL